MLMGIVAIVDVAIIPCLQQCTTPRARTSGAGAELRHTVSSKPPPFLALDMRPTRRIGEIYDKNKITNIQESKNQLVSGPKIGRCAPFRRTPYTRGKLSRATSASDIYNRRNPPVLYGRSTLRPCTNGNLSYKHQYTYCLH